MKAEDVKDILTINDIYDLMVELDASPNKKGNQILCRTICHGGHKHKLTYIEEKKIFRCWTDCGCFYDIFSLVGKVFNMDFPSSFKYICNKFNINYLGNFEHGELVDTAFIKKFKKKEQENILNEIPKQYLNSYYKGLYSNDWVKDGISVETMIKFNILFSINENKIIIPHFDVDNRLLGVRGRALNKDEVDRGKKYMPVYHRKGGVLKFPTGGNLFGININKQKIMDTKKVILVEAEKGVMQLDSMNFYIPGVALSGSNMSDEQLKLLLNLNVEEVIVALDKEFENEDEEEFYKEKILSSVINKMLPYFRVSVIWDYNNRTHLKDSPTDYGYETFYKLFTERIFI